MQPGDRRRFLMVAAGGMAAAASGGAWRWQWRSQEAVSPAPDWPVTTRTTHALGTEVSIAVRHPTPAVAKRAITAAFAELALVERLMSIYRPDSQLSRLNATGMLEQPHPYVFRVLRHAEQVSAASGGAFDITIQPLWETFAAAARQQRLPSDAAIAAARRRVDWRNVAIETNAVSLTRPGMAITLNGIAQGFAADCVLAQLQSHGIEHALVNTGELAPIGASSRGDDWTAGIQHPRQEDAFAAIAGLDGRALATSGDYATRFSADGLHHHILDPRSGCSPTQIASVSVAAPTAMQADALSTALFVLGIEPGLAMLQRCPGADALFVLRDGGMVVTPGFPLRDEGRAA